MAKTKPDDVVYRITPKGLLQRRFGKEVGQEIVDVLELHLRRGFCPAGSTGAIILTDQGLIFDSVQAIPKPAVTIRKKTVKKSAGKPQSKLAGLSTPKNENPKPA